MKTKYGRLWFAYILLAAMIVACSDSQVTLTSTNVSATAAPTITPPPPTATIVPTATAIPLVWNRVTIGQEFPRDTVNTIAVDPKDLDIIYVGMANAGVYKSIDGGLSWSPAFAGISNLKVFSLQIDPQDTQTLYVSLATDLFYVSTNGGENWQRTNLERGLDILIDPKNSSHLFAWSDVAFYESFDKGRSWNENYRSSEGDCPQSYGDNGTAGILSNGTTTLYILAGGIDSCTTGTYQSKDAGRTWALLYGGDENNSYEFNIGRDLQGNDALYITTNDAGIVVSYDRGETWEQSPPDYCSVLTVDEEIPTTAYCGESETSLSITEDGGHTWRKFGTETKFGNIRSIHVDHPHGNSRILVGGTNGFYASIDAGNSWVELANDWGVTNIQMRIDPFDKTVMFADAQAANYLSCSLFRSLDQGKSWKSVLTSSYPARCEPEFNANNDIYLIQNGSMVVSSDRGNTWSILSKPDGVNNLMWVNVSQYQSGPLYGGEIEQGGARPIRVFYSNDGGSSWLAGAEIALEPWEWDLQVIFDPKGKYIYAYGIHNVFRSEDGGMNWSPCATMDDIGFSMSDSSLAIDPKDGAHFFLAAKSGTRGGLFTSQDGCQTWQNTGLDNLFVNTVAIDPKNPSIIYAGTDSGAYISSDDGATWGEINNGLLGANVVYSIAVDKDSNVYASTPNGIFQLASK